MGKSAASLLSDPARRERRRALLDFLADPPREALEAAVTLREASAPYGEDAERELADLEAGTHPLQRAPKDPTAG
jgi:hypothetical protein